MRPDEIDYQLQKLNIHFRIIIIYFYFTINNRTRNHCR